MGFVRLELTRGLIKDENILRKKSNSMWANNTENITMFETRPEKNYNVCMAAAKR